MMVSKYMINGTTIYKNMECKNHSVIVANGVLSESYLDMNNLIRFG